jgi:hypothetical protein
MPSFIDKLSNIDRYRQTIRHNGYGLDEVLRSVRLPDPDLFRDVNLFLSRLTCRERPQAVLAGHHAAIPQARKACKEPFNSIP